MRRKLSVAKIIELRNAIHMSFPPQYAAQFSPDGLAHIVEDNLRTYLEFSSDMAPPPAFQRAKKL